MVVMGALAVVSSICRGGCCEGGVAAGRVLRRELLTSGGAGHDLGPLA